MIASVVDSNVMNVFQRERLEATQGEAHLALDAVFSHGYIALDDAGHCEAEWLDCAEGAEPLLLKDWIADMYVEERIRLVPLDKLNLHKELTSLGVPKKDHKWVKLAISAGSPLLITEDIDLICPKAKNSVRGRARVKMIESGRGPVSNHLKKNYRIIVVCCKNCPDTLARLTS